SYKCQVMQTFEWLQEKINSGQLTHPRCQQKAYEIMELVHDVATGGAGKKHLSSLISLSQLLVDEGLTTECKELGQELGRIFSQYEETFQSHIKTHTCPTGDCPRLTPAPCQMACPAGIDIPSYLTLIGQGEYEEAIRIIREDNPFAWVCGLVCTHPCEFMCVRARMDSPISIMHLKGFAAEKCISKQIYLNPKPRPDNGHKACVIGAGPGGLSGAYYLALLGYQVTVIESLPVPGGMMMVGIPRYRLPREVIDREVAMIEELGVDIRLNTRLGRDISIDDLQAEGFQAFIIAIGAHSSYKLMIPGEDEYRQVVSAVDFLRRVNLGDHHKPGRKVAVVGGGNVAIDAARTCIRLGCQQVNILYRRSHDQMPAHKEEVIEAEEEGVHFYFLTIPSEIVGQDGKVTGIKCLRAELSQPDDSGRQKPVPIKNSEHVLEVDAVIPAIGQDIDIAGLEGLSEINWTRRNTISVHTSSMSTDKPGFFAAGDVVTGPATVVEAIAGGKRAALAIHRYFEGIPQPSLPPVPVRRKRADFFHLPASLKMDLKRSEVEVLNTERRRITFQQVHLGLTEDKALKECQRCLRCDVCIRCGKCVEICRDKMGIDALHLGYMDFDNPGPTDLKITAERCICCGACATNCPTGAMQMEDRGQERILSLCGTELNRLKLEYCEYCGQVLGPARYHDYIMQRIKDISPALGNSKICIDCARKKSGQIHAETEPPKFY
ncbi:MAG TPA: NAD(P)-binding protein, partial [Desulfohalobiaceae bacterium]|nr:NAD(P)-binding protein [Desulfohalobiaceae bacterium]